MNKQWIELREWVIEAVSKTALDGEMRDAHIDLFSHYKAETNQQIFELSSQTINAVTTILNGYDTDGIGIYLQLNLISKSKRLKRAPQNLSQLIELIDPSCVPELVVYKPVESTDIPLNEFYRVPIYFVINTIEKELMVLYKEWRFHSSEVFQRERDCSLNCVSQKGE